MALPVNRILFPTRVQDNHAPFEDVELDYSDENRIIENDDDDNDWDLGLHGNSHSSDEH